MQYNHLPITEQAFYWRLLQIKYCVLCIKIQFCIKDRKSEGWNVRKHIQNFTNRFQSSRLIDFPTSNKHTNETTTYRNNR